MIEAVFEKFQISWGEATSILVAGAGSTLTQNSGAETKHATGKRKAYTSKIGKATLEGKCGFILSPTYLPIIGLVLPEDIPEFNFEDGQDKATKCLCSAFTLKGEAEGYIECNMDFQARGKTTSSVLGAATLVNPYVGTLLLTTGLHDIDFANFEISIANGLTAEHGMLKKAGEEPDADLRQRLPSKIARNYQDVTLKMNFLEEPDIDAVADTIEKISEATITIPTEDRTGTLVITLANLLPKGLPRDKAEEGLVKFDLEYTVEDITIGAGGD